jgi:hypothetical protein
MAKKIIISFNSQPVAGDAFEYSITIGGFTAVYLNGLNIVSVDYTANGVVNAPPTTIEIQPTLQDTIYNTLFFLNKYYRNNSITYAIVDNTIELSINSDLGIAITYGAVNPSLTISDKDIVVNTSNNLRYFLQYNNIVNDEYKCEIYKKGYKGISTEIKGKVTIDKGGTKEHLDAVRGTGLSLELEATTLLNLEDLYTDDERDFTVKLYKNNIIIFVGYLKPDGVFQDYVNDVWKINIDCIDGLGALDNLSFVRESGLYFTGKMRPLDIIYYCLKRSGISLPINTSINTFYEGLTIDSTTNILNKIFLNADRFVKTDNNTIMSCDEVLKSVLDIFTAVITQQNGEWYIYKPNELSNNAFVDFKRYNISNVYVGNVSKNLNVSVGSQIDNFYPHHCNGNQRIEIKGAVSAYRLGYKYGFVKGLIDNDKFYHVVDNYTPWQILLPNAVIYDTSTNLGLRMNASNQNAVLVMRSENLPLLEGDSFSLDTKLSAFNDLITFSFKVRLGIYYLTNSGAWVTSADSIFNSLGRRGDLNPISQISGSFSLKAQPLPIAGDVFVEVYTPRRSFGNSSAYGVVNSIDLVNTFEGDNKDGEFHTVSRGNKVSSIIKSNKEVFNGDNVGIVYNGAIFKEDSTTLTNEWKRKGFYELSPLLRIAAEEELRISQKPLKVFTGDLYGYVDYLSVININNIDGKFMPIEYSYNTFSNVTNVKYLELFADEISDIKYDFTYDYGNTVKPTIES